MMLNGETLEIMIFINNATSVGLNKEDDLNININELKKGKFFYDVIYNPPMTNFLKRAKKLGHQTLNVNQ